MTIRVFLLDDHEMVREGVRSLLESDEEIEVVGEAATVAEALVGSRWPDRTSPFLTFGLMTAAASRSAGYSIDASRDHLSDAHELRRR